MLVCLLQHLAVDYFVVVVAFQPVGRPSLSPALVGTYLLLVARGLEYIYPQVVQQTHAVVVGAAAAVAEGDIAFGDGIAVQPVAVLLLA